MKVLIIDNDRILRYGLRKMLEDLDSSVTISEAGGVTEGLKAIEEFKPEVVFLDVEMDDGTGFDLIAKLHDVNFQLIFITAHDKYAINAFKLNAIDFLLKPIDILELEQTLVKVEKEFLSRDMMSQLNALQNTLKELNPKNQRIVLKDSKSIYFVKIEDIICCESEGSYTTFFLELNKKITVSKSLKEFEQLLEPYDFMRPHNSHLVNKTKIIRLDKANNGTLVLSNGAEIPISQRKWEIILKELNS